MFFYILADNNNMAIDPNDLVGIPIKDFITGKNMPVDVHLKLSETKFILVAKAGAPVDLEQLKRYENKSIEELHVHKDDYSKFIDQGLRIAGILLSHKDLDEHKKAQVLTKAAANVFQAFDRMNFSPEIYNQAKTVTENCVKLVEMKPDLLHLLKSITELNQNNSAHAIATSTLSVMIAKKLDWVAPATIEKLALGGMLIDVGQKEVPPEIVKKRRIDMTHEERQAFESHPYRGAMLLQSLNIVPDDVIAIVYEHHENAIGQGFPRRLKDLTMHPLSKVVCLAGSFCDLTFDINGNDKIRTASEAVHYIQKTLGQPFNKQAFAALKEIVEDSESKAA